MVEGRRSAYGNFRLKDTEVWGELTLAHVNTCLTLGTEGHLPQLSATGVIHGRLNDFTFVTCVDCVGGESPDLHIDRDGNTRSSWNVFPHIVLTGRSHFHCDVDRIRKVWFSTGDTEQLCKIPESAAPE